MESIISIEEINEGAYDLYIKATYKSSAKKIALFICIPSFIIGFILPFVLNIASERSGVNGKLILGFVIGIFLTSILLGIYIIIMHDVVEKIRKRRFMKAPQMEWVKKFLKKIEDDAIEYERKIDSLKEAAKLNYMKELVGIEEEKDLLFQKVSEAKNLVG